MSMWLLVVRLVLETLQQDLKEFHETLKTWHERGWERLLKQEATTGVGSWRDALRELQSYLYREVTVSTFVGGGRWGRNWSTTHTWVVPREFEDKVETLEGASSFIEEFYQQQIAVAERLLMLLASGKEEWGEQEEV